MARRARLTAAARSLKSALILVMPRMHAFRPPRRRCIRWTILRSTLGGSFGEAAFQSDWRACTLTLASIPAASSCWSKFACAIGAIAVDGKLAVIIEPFPTC